MYIVIQILIIQIDFDRKSKLNQKVQINQRMIQIYQHFIRQVQQQQIRAYNEKHRAYLNRVAKERPIKVQNKRQRKRDYTFQRGPNPKITTQSANNNHVIPISIKQTSNQATPVQKFYIEQQTEYIQQPLSRIQPQQRKINTKPPSFNQLSQQQVQKLELIECPQGCGRKFKPQLIQKHSKVCKKVFQEKAKPKLTKVFDQQAQDAKQKAEKTTKNQKQKKGKKYDWKIESQKFRNAMKATKGQSAPCEIIDDRIECPGCGRKFSQNAAQRHIAFCTKKTKR